MTIERDARGGFAPGSRVQIHDGRIGVIVGRSKRRWHAYRVEVDGKVKEYGWVASAPSEA